MFDYAVANILKRWPRSLLTVLGVAMMMTLVIVTTGIVAYQLRTVNEHASATAGKIFAQPALAGDTYPAQGIDMPEDTARRLLARSDIQTAISGKVIFLPIQAPLYPTEPPELILVGVEPGNEEAFTGSIGNDVKPLQGAEHFSGCSIASPVILGWKAAEVLAAECGCEVKVGSRIRVLQQEWEVIGVLESSGDKVVNNALIVPLPEAQALLDKSGFVSAVILVPQRVDGKVRLIDEIRSAYPRLNLVTDDHIQKNLVSGIRLFEDMVSAISVVVILGAALLIMTVVLITVRERTREIGVLRALGASRWFVIRSVLMEIFLLSLAGSVAGGAVAGLVLRFGMMENLFDAGHILQYMPLALALTLIAGLLPAWQIARIQPVESLRYE